MVLVIAKQAGICSVDGLVPDRHQIINPLHANEFLEREHKHIYLHVMSLFNIELFILNP